MPKVLITRRSALIAGVSAPVLASVGNILPSTADGHAKPVSAPYSTFKLGDFNVTTLLAGTRVVEDDPQKTFGMNVGKEEFSSVSRDNFIPDDKSRFYFTPTLVETGSEVVLFDTGLPGGGLVDAMKAAGFDPAKVSVVVLTHMHPDHIGGLMGDGGPTFPNARYVTGQVEYDFWSKMEAGNRVGDMVAKMVTPLAEKMTFIGDGDSVVSGFTGVAAFGHTPGHMVYMVESAGKQVLLTADTANHYVWSLAYPDWEVRFDADKAAAAATRKKIFGMVASDRIPFVGYHMPFPAVGYVEARGEGFRYVPETYQLDL